MAYLTAAQLTTIKQEINVLLSTSIYTEIQKYKNTAKVDWDKRHKYILLAMANEIIQPFTAVTDSSDDGVINAITDANLQILIGKIYKEFYNLQYPN